MNVFGVRHFRDQTMPYTMTFLSFLSPLCRFRLNIPKVTGRLKRLTIINEIKQETHLNKLRVLTSGQRLHMRKAGDLGNVRDARGFS